MNREWFTLLSLAVAVLGSGCHARYIAPDVVPVELLEVYRQPNAEIPARVQVVDFAINTVDANYSDDGKQMFRRYQSHEIPKKLYELLGVPRTFTEVKRAPVPDPQSTDYVVSGTYDYVENRVRAPYYHEIGIKGTLRARVVRARDHVQIFQKDYVEERSDSASSFQPIRVLYLQEAFLRPIAADVKNSIAQDQRTSRAQ